MTFTDDDLKRLKESLYCDHDGPSGCLHPIYGPPEIETLLDRLEAAENCAKGLSNLVALQRLKGSPKDLIEAWRKACGK
jgi:hypothetical protein